jgi:hypothetical protein
MYSIAMAVVWKDVARAVVRLLACESKLIEKRWVHTNSNKSLMDMSLR